VGPIKVEVISQSNWWLPWLPVLASGVVAAVAVTGVVLSYRTSRAAVEASRLAIEANRQASEAAVETNRLAITAADNRAIADRGDAHDRDFRLWQRDNLLRLSADVIDSAVQARDEFFEIAHGLEDVVWEKSRNVDQWSRKVGANSATLRLIGAYATADRCINLRNTMNDRTLINNLYEFNKDWHRGLENQMSQGNFEDDQNTDWVVSARAEFDAGLRRIDEAREAFGAAVERELRRFDPAAETS
jgi:hypothetical protein